MTKIQGYAMRELIFGDYTGVNWRELFSAVEEACNAAKIGVIEWESISPYVRYAGTLKRSRIPVLDFYSELI
jgi:hypothetical protein